MGFTPTTANVFNVRRNTLCWCCDGHKCWEETSIGHDLFDIWEQNCSSFPGPYAISVPMDYWLVLLWGICETQVMVWKQLKETKTSWQMEIPRRILRWLILPMTAKALGKTVGTCCVCGIWSSLSEGRLPSLWIAQFGAVQNWMYSLSDSPESSEEFDLSLKLGRRWQKRWPTLSCIFCKVASPLFQYENYIKCWKQIKLHQEASFRPSCLPRHWQIMCRHVNHVIQAGEYKGDVCSLCNGFKEYSLASVGQLSHWSWRIIAFWWVLCSAWIHCVQNRFTHIPVVKNWISTRKSILSNTMVATMFHINTTYYHVMFRFVKSKLLSISWILWRQMRKIMME